jgi:hypothetical protein
MRAFTGRQNPITDCSIRISIGETAAARRGRSRSRSASDSIGSNITVAPTRYVSQRADGAPGGKAERIGTQFYGTRDRTD